MYFISFFHLNEETGIVDLHTMFKKHVSQCSISSYLDHLWDQIICSVTRHGGVVEQTPLGRLSGRMDPVEEGGNTGILRTSFLSKAFIQPIYTEVCKKRCQTDHS